MLEMYVRLMNLFKSEEGQGLVEYALIIVLVAIAVVGALSLLGGTVNNTFTNIQGQLTK
jgi:pilus assembly protein Flp/PilA